MDKLEDLIQLNLIKGNENFMLKNYYTNIKVDGEISEVSRHQILCLKAKTKDGKLKLKTVISRILGEKMGKSRFINCRGNITLPIFLFVILSISF